MPCLAAAKLLYICRLANFSPYFLHLFAMFRAFFLTFVLTLHPKCTSPTTETYARPGCCWSFMQRWCWPCLSTGIRMPQWTVWPVVRTVPAMYAMRAIFLSIFLCTEPVCFASCRLCPALCPPFWPGWSSPLRGLRCRVWRVGPAACRCGALYRCGLLLVWGVSALWYSVVRKGQRFSIIKTALPAYCMYGVSFTRSFGRRRRCLCGMSYGQTCIIIQSYRETQS